MHFPRMTVNHLLDRAADPERFRRAQMKILQSRIWVYFLYAFAFHSGPDAAIWSDPFPESRQIQGKFRLNYGGFWTELWGMGRISASFYFQAFFNLDSVGIGWYGVFLSASSLVTQFGTRQTIPSWKLWLIDLSASGHHLHDFMTRVERENNMTRFHDDFNDTHPNPSMLAAMSDSASVRCAQGSSPGR